MSSARDPNQTVQRPAENMEELAPAEPKVESDTEKTIGEGAEENAERLQEVARINENPVEVEPAENLIEVLEDIIDFIVVSNF